jgi:hypothetical protein
MPAIALKDTSESLAGFLIISGDGPLVAVGSRDCLLMVAPLPASSSARDFLSARKHREFAVSITSEDTAFRVKGECGPSESLELFLTATGVGHWQITSDDKPIVSGQCEIAKGK